MATYVLIHDAWHGGWSWQKVVPLLRTAGHDVYAPTLTGLGERAHLIDRKTSLDTHVQDVVGLIEFKDLKDVVLVGHGYGGSVIRGVADQIPEALAHMIYLNAFVIDDGKSLAQFLGPEHRAAVQERARQEGEGWKLPPYSPEWYGVTRREDIEWMRPRLTPQPLKTEFDPMIFRNPKAESIPKSYIFCNAPAIGRFGEFAQRARTEPGWQYRELATGHDAMISQPKELSRLLLELVSVSAVSTGTERAELTRLDRYRGGLSRRSLKLVLEYIHAHLHDNVQLSSLAEIAGLNLYHFAKAFKQSTGESPHQYTLRRRIERARELLRDPHVSVLEVSARTGFVDQSHFSKVFRRIAGVAPSECRNARSADLCRLTPRLLPFCPASLQQPNCRRAHCCMSQ